MFLFLIMLMHNFFILYFIILIYIMYIVRVYVLTLNTLKRLKTLLQKIYCIITILLYNVIKNLCKNIIEIKTSFIALSQISRALFLKCLIDKLLIQRVLYMFICYTRQLFKNTKIFLVTQQQQ